MWVPIDKGDFLKAVRSAGGAKKVVATEILETVQVWLEGKFGGQVSKLCKPVAIVSTTLRIQSSSPPMSREIRLIEKELIAHMNEKHPSCAIDTIQITS